MDSHVVLIGHRGSGKTTVGRLLADRLGVAFLDADEIIAREAGVSIAEIFAAEGEAGFRRRESAIIRAIAHAPPAVVSLGGGAVVDESNLVQLRNRSRFVWLKCAVEVMHARIEADAGSAANRPALTDLPAIEEMQTMLANREPIYQACAQFVVVADREGPMRIAQQIAEML